MDKARYENAVKAFGNDYDALTSQVKHEERTI